MTLWVKPLDIAGARYAEVEDVDLQQTVSKFIARWMAQAKLDVDPSRVTLRLVRCAGEEPTAMEEAAATVLSPRRTLREAGVTAGCSLLAFVAGAHDAVRLGCPACALTLTRGVRVQDAGRGVLLVGSIAGACFVWSCLADAL